MSQNILSETLTSEEVHQIAATDDFHIAPYREDGETFGTLTWIWSVEVDGNLFVRAYHGTKSRWYNSALKQRAGKITAAGMAKKVSFEPIHDDALNDSIDEAYKKKYQGSPYLKDMITEKTRAATVQVKPYKD